jgi:hypothetical protein
MRARIIPRTGSMCAPDAVKFNPSPTVPCDTTSRPTVLLPRSVQWWPNTCLPSVTLTLPSMSSTASMFASAKTSTLCQEMFETPNMRLVSLRMVPVASVPSDVTLWSHESSITWSGMASAIETSVVSTSMA